MRRRYRPVEWDGRAVYNNTPLTVEEAQPLIRQELRTYDQLPKHLRDRIKESGEYAMDVVEEAVPQTTGGW